MGFPAFYVLDDRWGYQRVRGRAHTERLEL